MADEHYRWLDREAAERLLRGEPLESVDADTREQADRLSGALRSLAAAPPLSSDELPGEAAALAAFRTARAGAEGDRAGSGRERRTHGATRSADAGLVRLGRSEPSGRRTSWGRPVRLGLAATLAAGMIGGVAVAAGTGVLPTPFGEREPGPAASVSSAATPRQPLVSPSPGATGGRGSDAPSPDGSPQGSSPGSSWRDEARGGASASGRPDAEDDGTSGRAEDRRSRLLASCRDLRRGKQLDPERRRVLEDAAQGSGRVRKYCAGVLGDADGRSGADREGGGKEAGGKGDKGGRGGDDDHHHIGPGGNDHREHGETGPPASAGFAPPAAAPGPAERAGAGPSPVASGAPGPSPTYRALPVPAPS